MTENTLPGFLLALERGADAVELDTHVTSDGIVVVHHDDTVRGRPIAVTPWPALRELAVGRDARGRIPSLAEVLDGIADDATVYVELKGQNIEAAVIEVVRRHAGPYALHSFDHEAVERVAIAAPDVPRGVLLDRGTKEPGVALRRVAERIQPRDVWPHWSLIDPAFVAAAHSLDTRVVAWTVNSAESARRLAQMGVDAICTDDVGLLANI